MAAINASVNQFALLDGNDPGDKRLVDFDSQLKDQASGPAMKKPAPAAASTKKKPTSAAASTKKKPTSGAASCFKSEKNSPALAAGSKAPRKNLTPAVAAMAPSIAKATNKQTTAALPVPSTNLTGVLFAYPSARERIFKQRQEEFERRQAKARQEEYERQQAKVKGGSVSGDGNKSAGAGAPTADKRKGKTHGVRVKQDGGGYHYGGGKQQPVVTVKEAPAPAAKEPAVAPVVLQTPPPPPSVDDIVQFPSLSLK